ARRARPGRQRRRRAPCRSLCRRVGALMMMGGAPAGGGMFGGPGGGRAGTPPAGLPFGGIPSELQAGVDRLLAAEPDHGEPAAVFTQRMTGDDSARLTLRRLITRHRRLLLLAVVFVAVVAWLAGAYLACVAVTGLAQRSQVRVTGRLAASVMNDLRVKVFAHLQRLSLDFFTREKAGVVMTRMTSDIENLQQLLQDGLAQFAVQGLTMVVITAVLFTLDVRLALITVLLIVPILTAMSLWFRSASERRYIQVRDGIANVLADLSESLHGVRIVTAHNRQRHNVLHHRNV